MLFLFFFIGKMGLHAEVRVHKVKKGQTLLAIASRYAVSVDELATYNDLKNRKILQIGQSIRIPPKYSIYVVKSGDTLSDIAETHKVSLKALKSVNLGVKPSRLQIGQELQLPKDSGVLEAPGRQAPGVLPRALKKALDRIPVKSRKWKSIVIHHSASSHGTMKGIDRYHREDRHMINGLAYHFVIGNGKGMKNGEVGIGNRWKKQIQGGHLASEKQNKTSLGICLIGNFEKTQPTRAQMKSLKVLLGYLMRRTGLNIHAVMGHKHINTKPTACPGKYFDLASLGIVDQGRRN